MPNNLTIYTTPNCVKCRITKKFLIDRQRDYDAVMLDVTSSDPDTVAESQARIDWIKATYHITSMPLVLVRDENGAVIDWWHNLDMPKLNKWYQRLPVAAR